MKYENLLEKHKKIMEEKEYIDLKLVESLAEDFKDDFESAMSVLSKMGLKLVPDFVYGTYELSSIDVVTKEKGIRLSSVLLKDFRTLIRNLSSLSKVYDHIHIFDDHNCWNIGVFDGDVEVSYFPHYPLRGKSNKLNFNLKQITIEEFWGDGVRELKTQFDTEEEFLEAILESTKPTKNSRLRKLRR